MAGRPATNYGPPIGLFHPVFDSFRSAITSMKPLPDNAATDTDTGELTIYMRVASAKKKKKKCVPCVGTEI